MNTIHCTMDLVETDAKAEEGEAGVGMERRMPQRRLVACAAEQRRLQTIPTATEVKRKDKAGKAMPTTSK